MVNPSFPLRASTFVGIQTPIPEFEGNEKKTREIRIKPPMLKSPFLPLQEIASWIISRKGERHDKTDQPTKGANCK